MINETFFSLLSIGFNICFIVYLLFKYFYENHNKYYLFLALLSFSFITNVYLRLDFVESDYTIIRVTRKLIVLLFYVFMLSFLNLKNNRLLRSVLVGGIVFIGIGILSRIFKESFYYVAIVHQLYKTIYPFVDLVLIVALIIYVFKQKESYHRFVLGGLVSTLFCALVIYLGENFFNLKHYVSGYIVFQTEIIICFSFFFLAVLSKENTIKVEKLHLEKKILLQHIENQKILHQERERIAYDMHDELGAGISAIKLQSELLKKHVQNETKEDINRLILISDEMNRSMREILWSLNPENDTLISFFNYSKNYIDTYFANTDITVLFDQKAENPTFIMKPEIRRNLLLMTKEMCHNILKHSKATQVKIKMFEDNYSLSLLIEDNGIGFQNNNSKFGHGISSIRKRAQNLNGDIEISSTENGTIIRINITITD